MKKITDKNKYSALLKVLLTQDISRKDSVMKTVVFNKIINYLYLKLPDDKKASMLEMLKDGISNDFLVFMGEQLDDEDMKVIAQSSSEEFANIFNYALIANTDGN